MTFRRKRSFGCKPKTRLLTHCRMTAIVLLLIAVGLITVLTSTPALAAPTVYLGIGTTTSTSISVTWTSTGLTGVTGYRVYYGFSSTALYSYVSCPATATGATITGLRSNVMYYLKVRAITSTGNVDSSVRTAITQASSGTTAPTEPTNLTASATSTSKITLKWTDTSANETGFRIERSEGPDGPFTQVATTGAGATTYTNQNLAAGTPYYYRVCAYNSVGNSTYSNVASATTLDGPPVAPSGLSGVLVTKGQISLQWTDNSTNETSFKIERATSSTGTYSQIGTVATDVTSYLDVTIGTASAYYYRVRASNTAGNSAYSNVAGVSTVIAKPAAPSGLTATASSSTQIDLHWTDASTNETGFYVERAATASGPFSQVASIGAGVTTWSNTGLSSSTTYYYRVCAYNSGGNSTYSAVAGATTQAPPVVVPADPSSLAATTASTSQINLQWTDNSNNETGFYVERAASQSGPFAQVGSAGAGATTWSNTGLVSATAYYYRVRAYNSAGGSGYTNVASATTGTTPPTAPTSLAASATGSSQINLTWTDTASNESGFYVERSASQSGPFSQIASVGAGATAYSDGSLTAATTYYYRVCAYNAGGSSGYSNVAGATTQALPPTAPSGLSASAVSTTSIGLSWTDNSGNETGFKVERGANQAGPFAQIATTGAGVASYSDSGLTNGTTYYYRVRATGAGGDSGYSNVASATTQVGATVPAAPSNLVSTGVGTIYASFSWADNSNNETGFKVQRSLSSGGTFSDVAILGAGTTGWSDSGLAASTTYYYRVYAYNAMGSSAFSNTVAITTTADGLAAPTNLVGTAISTNQVGLTWTDNSSNETGFRIEKGSAQAGPFTYLASVSVGVTSYTDLYVVQATTYYYRVCAYNNSTNSGYTNVVSVTTKTNAPIAPTSLSAAAKSTSQIDLQWSDGSSDETGFKVERSASASGPFGEVASLGAGVTSWSNTGLASGTTYYFRVCAYNAGGNSGYTNIASATTQQPVPAAPSGLSATVASPSQIDLAWTDNSNNETGFKVERSSNQAGPFAEVASLGAGTASWSNTGLAAPGSYYYRVCAYNETGKSAYTNVAGGSVALPAPTNLTIPTVTDSQMVLTWTAVPANITGYRVEIGTAAGGPFSTAGTVLYTKTTFTSSPLAEDTTYYYRVCAYSASGDSPFATVSETTKLKAPTNLTATHISDTEIDLVWTDNSSKESNFVLERSVSGGAWAVLATLGANVTAYADTSCMPNTLYEYRVKATGSISDYSNTLTVQTLAKVYPVPVLTGFLSDIGTAKDVVVAGTRAYVASDPFGLVILDISNPAAPTVLGSEHLGGPATKVSVSGSVAVASGTPRGTDIIDISNPASPRVASYLAGTSVDATVSGGYAYAAAAGDLKIINVTNPYAASLVSTVVTPGSAYGVAVSGNKVVVCDSTYGLQVVDVTNKQSPYIAGSVALGGTAWKVAISGDLALVANSGLARLQVVDISAPTSPRILSWVYTGVGASSVSVSGTRAYVCAGGNGLYVIDFSNPTAAYMAAQYVNEEVRTTPFGCSAQNGLAFVAGGSMGLQVLDLSSGYPDPLSVLVQGSTAVQVAISGNVVAAAGTPRGTEFIDISDPTSPKRASSVAGTSVDVALSGGYAYAAAAGDLKIINVTNPYAPSLVSTVVTPGSAYGVAVSGNKVVVCDSTYGLHVVDVTSKQSPYIAGSVALGGTAWKVAISGSLALVANSGLGSLQVVDISAPTSPRILSTVSTGVGASNVAVEGTRAYVCAGGNGLYVIDFSLPTAAYMAAQYSNNDLRTAPVSCTVQNGIVYAVGVTTGMSVMDLTDIENPVFTGLYKGLGGTLDVIIDGGLLITADNKSEIGVFTF